MCRGIFASSSHHLSMRSCFPLLYNYEQQYGSILRGMVSAKPGKLLSFHLFSLYPFIHLFSIDPFLSIHMVVVHPFIYPAIHSSISSFIEHSGVENNKLVKRSKKEKWMIYTFKNGLQTLTDTLTTAAETVGVDIITNTTVTGVVFENEHVKVTQSHRNYTKSLTIYYIR